MDEESSSGEGDISVKVVPTKAETLCFPVKDVDCNQFKSPGFQIS